MLINPNAIFNVMEAGAVIATVIVCVIGIVGIQIVSDSLTAANFTGLLATVTDNVPIFMGIGLLVAAIAWAIL